MGGHQGPPIRRQAALPRPGAHGAGTEAENEEDGMHVFGVGAKADSNSDRAAPGMFNLCKASPGGRHCNHEARDPALRVAAQRLKCGMSELPKISVITPSFNSIHTLAGDDRECAGARLPQPRTFCDGWWLHGWDGRPASGVPAPAMGLGKGRGALLRHEQGDQGGFGRGRADLKLRRLPAHGGLAGSRRGPGGAPGVGRALWGRCLYRRAGRRNLPPGGGDLGL